MDPIVDHIEQQKQARHDLERDFGPPGNGGSVLECQVCGSHDVEDRDGVGRICEACSHSWEEK